MNLPKVINTFSGPMKVRAWGVLQRTGELLVDLGTNGVPGNGYQDRPSWYGVDDELFPRYDPQLQYEDTVMVVKEFSNWAPRTSCGCI